MPNTIERRQLLILVAGTALFGASWRPVAADAKLVEEAVGSVLNGRSPQEGRIKLGLPEIAENGNTVPLKFDVESPMTADDYVKSVHVYAEGNPLPEVATFHFHPASGRAHASTRMRLAKTQNVIAVAEMSDGSVYMAKRSVKVTIGGCGG